jgi:hypothetical protein
MIVKSLSLEEAKEHVMYNINYYLSKKTTSTIEQRRSIARYCCKRANINPSDLNALIEFIINNLQKQ